MATTATPVAELCLSARDAARVLAATDTATKDRALHAIADALEARTAEILEANARDLEAGRESGLSGALMDRLPPPRGARRGRERPVRRAEGPARPRRGSRARHGRRRAQDRRAARSGGGGRRGLAAA